MSRIAPGPWSLRALARRSRDSNRQPRLRAGALVQALCIRDHLVGDLTRPHDNSLALLAPERRLNRIPAQELGCTTLAVAHVDVPLEAKIRIAVFPEEVVRHLLLGSERRGS